ncbi:ATP-binding cassette domain-containing protein [Scytonema sp. UIC 10036]|uniref:ABC transporter ATP-binding protein n=1 Tax=Scytonema sp. UIC 10036 TaxID=2304196 RepID=UPI0012DA9385|nr:ABC transporter ATP-binding protein [Scytonema sp. UIC 10036]MUG92203.1 ATP-binding cassette domain-containing protein [Scytonema sp. UIC 10036]
MLNDPPAVTLSHVSKIYANGTVALQNLNLNIQESEFVSCVGASGCGKSTVLRIIAGLVHLSSGSIHWSRDRKQQKLAFVFQDAALLPWANVMENVYLPMKLAGVPRKDAMPQVKQAIARVGLEKFEDNYPRQLSGGMKMRVSIARALVQKPDMLLMDEPFGSLDEITRTKLHIELLDLYNQYCWTVVFVTHNIYEAVYLSNRVLVMSAKPGCVVAEIKIDAPYPRNNAFRNSLKYNEYCREVAKGLSEAMGETVHN